MCVRLKSQATDRYMTGYNMATLLVWWFDKVSDRQLYREIIYGFKNKHKLMP